MSILSETRKMEQNGDARANQTWITDYSLKFIGFTSPSGMEKWMTQMRFVSPSFAWNNSDRVLKQPAPAIVHKNAVLGMENTTLEMGSVAIRVSLCIKIGKE